MISLLGNKCEKIGRVVPYNIIKEFSFNNNINYIEVSAKVGKNINQAFLCLTKQIYELTPIDPDSEKQSLSDK